MRLGYSVEIKGLEHVERLDGNVIFASNHVTELDPLLIVASLGFFSNKLPIIYVVDRKTIYQHKFKGWRKLCYGGLAFRIIGGFEAYRGLRDYNKALRNHIGVLGDGASVCVFPVGRIHGAGDATSARGGVSYLANKTGLPVIPIHIQGIPRGIRLGDYLRRRPRLKITFGRPILASDLFKNSLGAGDESGSAQFNRASGEIMKAIYELG
ncbi:MAG: lysophospholipid acyltransferase family protein [Candidatus Saccharibacteria bacterium]